MQSNVSIKPTLYLIPGYSADGRVFSGLAEQGLEFEVLEHPVPLKNEPLEAYVQRIGEGVDTSKPFYLGGLSMGGMITVELCKFLKPEKIVLISTTKDEAEFPWYIQLNRWLPLWRITPAVILKWWAIRTRFVVGKMKGADLKLFKDMIWKSDNYYFRWSMGQLCKWNNDYIPESYVHIHGNKDWLLPLRYIQGEVKLVEGGTHWMVMDRAKEVAQFIREYLGKTT